MSIPKYMTKDRPDSAKTIIFHTEKLVSYMFKITSNEKQFPKAFRYTLISQIRNTCLKLWRHVYNGCSRRMFSVKDFQKIQKRQRKAYTDLLDLKSLIVISMNIAKPGNVSYLAEVYEDTMGAFNHWVKSVKRSMKKAALREDKSPEAMTAKKQARIRYQASHMFRDEEGFCMLLPYKKDEEDEKKS